MQHVTTQQSRLEGDSKDMEGMLGMSSWRHASLGSGNVPEQHEEEVYYCDSLLNIVTNKCLISC